MKANSSVYPDFGGIRIENKLGVSPVGRDTQLIARTAAKRSFRDALEVGSGTGFITLYLRSLGSSCTGLDVSPAAVECARHNAALNRLETEFHCSDLFSRVTGTFDLIIFNPPWGSARSSHANSAMNLIKSLLPKEHPFLSRMTYPLIRTSRRSLIRRFLEESQEHLPSDGAVLILLHRSELDLPRQIGNFIPEEHLQRLGMQTLVLLRTC